VKHSKTLAKLLFYGFLLIGKLLVFEDIESHLQWFYVTTYLFL
jgi:hypothetical protein